MQTIDLLVQMSEGNSGAASFLGILYRNGGSDTIDKLNKIGIKGSDLYVLYSDLCGRDLSKVSTLVDKCPSGILADACSRQDYSGQELVDKYLRLTEEA